jgi:hypothetical protein
LNSNQATMVPTIPYWTLNSDFLLDLERKLGHHGPYNFQLDLELKSGHLAIMSINYPGKQFIGF